MVGLGEPGAPVILLVLTAVSVISLAVGMALGALIATADHQELPYEEALQSLRKMRGA